MHQREACLKLCFIKFCLIAVEKLNIEEGILTNGRQTIAKYLFIPKQNSQFLFLIFHPGKIKWGIQF